MKGELTEKDAGFLIERNLDGESLDELNSIGYTLRGAARALSIAYDIPEDGMLDRLREAANRGDLKVRDPRTGLTYTPSICRDFYERVSPDDLNSFFESQNVPYRVEVGRYTIPEAIRLLHENTGERFPELLAAVHADEIKAYAPGRYNKPIPDRSRLPRGISCGDEQLEFFGIDLDAWLAKHFPRVKFRFSQVVAGETGNGQKELPAKVGAGGTATRKEAKPKQETGEPFLQAKSKNSRAAVEKWVAWQAHDKVETTDNTDDLAKRIWKIADSFKYESERGKMTVASITKMLPRGLTGGRGKNKGVRGKTQAK